LPEADAEPLLLDELPPDELSPESSEPPHAARRVLLAPTTPAIPTDWRNRRRDTRSLDSVLMGEAEIYERVSEDSIR
jgi:hypothetical protein